MIRVIWSSVERLAPRIVSALLMLLLAVLLTPAQVGTYSWMVVALTLVQAALDVPARQLAPTWVSQAGGDVRLRKLRNLSALTGTAVLLLAWLSLFLSAGEPPDALGLLPMAFVPLASARSIQGVARLQRAGQWRWIATAQMSSAGLSLVATLPLLLLTHSVAASAMQALLAEACFFFLVSRRSGSLSASGALAAAPERAFRAFGAASVYSVLGWGQGQLDRVVVGAIAGPTALGLYAFSWALSRSLGDVISAATATVLRSELALAIEDSALIRPVVGRVLLRGVMLSGATVVVVLLACKLVLPAILGDSWAAALEIAPIMAVSAVPTVITWSITELLVARSRVRRALPARVFGVLLSLPVGLLAFVDLRATAWATIVRELLALLPLIVIARGDIPCRSLTICLVVCASLAALVVILNGAGT